MECIFEWKIDRKNTFIEWTFDRIHIHKTLGRRNARASPTPRRIAASAADQMRIHFPRKTCTNRTKHATQRAP